MKRIFTTVFLLATMLVQAQVQLAPKDRDNLVALSLLYSNDVNGAGADFAASVNALRTPALDHMADALIAAGRGDRSLLNRRFLARPTDEELQLWYVLREIHYNHSSKTKKPLPDTEVADRVLARKIDPRWLLDNYYYRIHGGIASLFNEADLRTVDIQVDSLGFTGETEKAIFFLNMMDALAGGRFKVLQAMRNTTKLLEFAARLPKFNGQEYYYCKNFSYPDFSYIGYDKTESYNERNVGSLYSTLIAHFSALVAGGEKDEARKVYLNSILHEPKYFGYSPYKKDLQAIYEQSK